MPSKSRPRRALSAPGGAITTDGDPALARRLADALDLPADADPRELTHGFHSFPARFHPLLCRRLLADGVGPGTTLLDPFVGSGTTLVEGLLLGARTLGVDVNPLAVELSRLKASVWTPTRRTQLVETAGATAERSLERVKRRARTRASGEAYDDPRQYAPHVFRELVGLREEIDAADPSLQGVLRLVLSSIVIKVSRQRSDTAAERVERAIGKGHASRLFARKADELARRLGELAAAVPRGTPPPDLRLGDARHLDHIANGSIDVILTSPPYLGTYDYAAQHARRFGWLGLDAGRFAALEIGARRRAVQPGPALAAWQADVDAFVAEMGRVLRPGGRAFVVIGDSAVGAQVVPGDAAVRRAAARARLHVVASAAEERPSFYAPARRAIRREHLLHLTHF
jgi:DNA modification methylase